MYLGDNSSDGYVHYKTIRPDSGSNGTCSCELNYCEIKLILPGETPEDPPQSWNISNTVILISRSLQPSNPPRGLYSSQVSVG